MGLSRINTDWSKSNWPKSSILEQGDALMLALFSLEQHSALEAIQARLRPSERFMAFLDDIYGGSNRLAWRYVPSSTGARGDGVGDSHGSA